MTTWPWSRQVDDVLAATDHIRSDTDTLVAGQGKTNRTLERLERIITAMADQSALLNSVADGLRTLGGTIAALRDENTGLRARNAELEGEEVAESAATANVKAEFDKVAGLFTAEPDVPDVEPLPDAPVEEPPVE